MSTTLRPVRRATTPVVPTGAGWIARDLGARGHLLPRRRGMAARRVPRRRGVLRRLGLPDHVAAARRAAPLGRHLAPRLLAAPGPATPAGAVPAAHRGVGLVRCSSTATPPVGWGATSRRARSTSRTGGRSTCRSRTSPRPAARRSFVTSGRSRSRSSSTCCSRRCSCSASPSSVGARMRWVLVVGGGAVGGMDGLPVRAVPGPVTDLLRHRHPSVGPPAGRVPRHGLVAVALARAQASRSAGPALNLAGILGLAAMLLVLHERQRVRCVRVPGRVPAVGPRLPRRHRGDRPSRRR